LSEYNDQLQEQVTALTSELASAKAENAETKEQRDTLVDALNFCVEIAEGEINANWDDLLQYRELIQKIQKHKAKE